MLLITGGLGFIGSNFIRQAINKWKIPIINIDKVSYCSNFDNLSDIESSDLYSFKQVDLANYNKLKKVFEKYQPTGIIHFAAESHVDRSIDSPFEFIQSNIIGTYNLLEVTRRYLNQHKSNNFRFLHVSTDEVYGTLQSEDLPFNERTSYSPNSPYSASKAAADHLVNAWCHTYKMPVLTTNCSNNYGPFHFPEKLIPLVILNALEGNLLPVYGDGSNIRDWLYVEDHVAGVWKVFNEGKIGETYCIGGQSERTNLNVVETICDILDKQKPREDRQSYRKQICFVKDRIGHDFRYSIDISKISKELGWHPKISFEDGINMTIKWYLDNMQWVENIRKKDSYKNWINKQYA